MSSGTRCLLMAAVLLILPLHCSLHADTLNAGDIPVNDRRLFVAADYLFPLEDDRDLHTLNLHAYLPVKTFKSGRASLLAGVTATFVNGEITQTTGKVSDGSFKEVASSSDAVGLGPAVWVDLDLLRYKTAALHLEGSFGFIVYDQDFPAGGDWYNFMWRVGPIVRYEIYRSASISIGWQWMHVSNGQGSGPQNPSYDAHGATLQCSFSF